MPTQPSRPAECRMAWVAAVLTKATLAIGRRWRRVTLCWLCPTVLDSKVPILFRARLLPDSQGRDAGATGARGHVLAPSQLHGLTRFECLRKTLCAWLTSDAIDYEYFRAKATPSP
jgi:hypothetical protein